MTPDRKNRITTYIIVILLIIVVAFAIGVFNGGIRYGSSNHVGLIPVVRRMLNADYLPGDFNIQMRLYHHRVFAYIVAAFVTLFGEDRGLIMLSVISLLALSASIFALCRALNIPMLGTFLAGLFVALRVMWAGYGFEENTFTGNQEVQPPIFAHALILFGLSAIIKKNYLLPAFLAGLVLSLHLQIGLIFAILLAPFYLIKLREFGWKEIVRIAVLALLPALPALIHMAEMLKLGVNSDAFTLDYLIFRMPHHFEPMSQAHIYWMIGHVVILSACYWWLRQIKRSESRAVGVLLFVSLMLIALALLHFADFYILKIKTFVKPQFLRVSPLISVFSVLSLIATLFVWIDEKKKNAVQFRLIANTALALIAIGAIIYQVRKPDPEYSFQIQGYAEQKSTWVEVCNWIAANGPANTFYLTPPGRDGFTYLTNRSNIAEFKINPDGALYLKEWYERLTDLSGGNLPHEKGLANRRPLDRAYSSLNEEQLIALGNKYHADYAVLPKASKASFTVLFKNKDFRVVGIRGEGVEIKEQK